MIIYCNKEIDQQSTLIFFHSWPFLDLFWLSALHLLLYIILYSVQYIRDSVRKRVRNIYVDFFYCMNKFKLNLFFNKSKDNNIDYTNSH